MPFQFNQIYSQNWRRFGNHAVQLSGSRWRNMLEDDKWPPSLCQLASGLSFKLLPRGSKDTQETQVGLCLVGVCQGGSTGWLSSRGQLSQSQPAWGALSTLQGSHQQLFLCSHSPLYSISSRSHSWGLCLSWNLVPLLLPSFTTSSSFPSASSGPATRLGMSHRNKLWLSFLFLLLG